MAVVLSIRGLPGTIRLMRKLESNVPRVALNLHREVAKVAKKAAVDIINREARFTGQLAGSIQRRTTKKSSVVWTDAPHALFINNGFNTFMHRGQVSVAGYTANDWMNAKGIPQGVQGFAVNYVGIQFIERTRRREINELYIRLKKFPRELLK